MRKEVVIFIAVMVLTVLAAQFLPIYLGLPAGLVQDRLILALFPVLLIFVWSTW